jgi:hypothetical protein
MDVAQGNIGDCFLLSGINSVLSMPDGPKIIESIMKDNKDGTVTVRFFRSDAFEYVRIKKSLVHAYSDKFLGVRYGTEKVLHSMGANWVSLLEKAFLLTFRAGRGGTPGYNKLESGSGGDAVAAIVGRGRPEHVIGAGTSERDRGMDLYFSLVQNVSKHERFPPDPEVLDRMRAAIFGDGPESQVCMQQWKDWNNPDHRDRLLAADTSRTYDVWEEQTKPALEGLDKPTADCILIYVRNLGWRGEVGSAQYTKPQLDLFMKIQRLLAVRRPVTAGTKDTIPGQITGRGSSAGEPKVAGLAGRHSYAVMEAELMPDGLRWLKLRNPWGHYGRGYTMQGQGVRRRLTAKELPDAPEFWIELSDFSLNFNTIESGPQAHTDARAGLMHNLDAQLQQQKTQLKPPPPKGAKAGGK